MDILKAFKAGKPIRSRDRKFTVDSVSEVEGTASPIYKVIIVSLTGERYCFYYTPDGRFRRDELDSEYDLAVEGPPVDDNSPSELDVDPNTNPSYVEASIRTVGGCPGKDQTVYAAVTGSPAGYRPIVAETTFKPFKNQDAWNKHMYGPSGEYKPTACTPEEYSKGLSLSLSSASHPLNPDSLEEVEIEVPDQTYRKDANKLPVGEIFKQFPHALEELARVIAFGATKYENHSWSKIPRFIERAQNSLGRHQLAVAKGEAFDPESGCLHQAHVIWNTLAILEHGLTVNEIPKAEEKISDNGGIFNGSVITEQELSRLEGILSRISGGRCSEAYTEAVKREITAIVKQVVERI